MASAMADHLRSLRPALALGPAAGESAWAKRIVYSVGTFDKPYADHTAVSSLSSLASALTLDGVASGNSSAQASDRTSVTSVAAAGEAAAFSDEGTAHLAAAATAMSAGTIPGEQRADATPLRFLREFGAVVIVGVYTDRAHAACHGGVTAAEPFQTRCARALPHADRVVAVDTVNANRTRDALLAASGQAATSAETDGVPSGGDLHTRSPEQSVAGRCSPVSSGMEETDHRKRRGLPRGGGAAAVEIGGGDSYDNCCFVSCDWDTSRSVNSAGGSCDDARRARREMRELMAQTMPVFRLPCPAWARAAGEGDEEESQPRY